MTASTLAISLVYLLVYYNEVFGPSQLMKFDVFENHRASLFRSRDLLLATVSTRYELHNVVLLFFINDRTISLSWESIFLTRLQ